MNLDFERVATSHQCLIAKTEKPCGQIRPIVAADNEVCWETFKKPIFNHVTCAAVLLFAGLKNKLYSAVKSACFSKVTRGQKCHSDVAVVSAGVHNAVIF